MLAAAVFRFHLLITIDFNRFLLPDAIFPVHPHRYEN